MESGTTTSDLPRPWDRGWEEIGGDAGMSNCDFEVDPGIEDQLRAGGTWTRYAGWNFNGRVWWEGEEFHCEVWRYGTPRKTIVAADLPTLMHAVSREYGYD